MNEQDQQRKIRHRIAVLRDAAEVTGNVAQTCRYYGISRWERVVDVHATRRARVRAEAPNRC
jgi:hypothetical protein